MHMTVGWGYRKSQDSIKLFNWNIFLNYTLNLIQILIIKKYVAWFLDVNKGHKSNNTHSLFP